MKTSCRNRQVAVAVGSGTAGVLITTENPIDLWYAGNTPVLILGCLAALGCLAVAILPRSPRTLPLAGLSVPYWIVRAIDAAWDAWEGERSYAQAIIHFVFGFVLFNYWNLSIRHEAMSITLRVGPPRDGD